MFNNIHVVIANISIVLSSIMLLERAIGSVDPAFYFIGIGMVLWYLGCCLRIEKLHIPSSNGFKVLLLFLVVVFISNILNINSIVAMKYKGVYAADNMLKQSLLLFLCILISIYLFNVFNFKMKNINLLAILEKMLLISFLIMGGYSFFELVSLLGVVEAREIVNFIDSIICSRSAEGSILGYFRIRSLTYEASILGTYCGVVFPWLFMKCLKQESNNYRHLFFVGVLIYFFILLIFSFSRTAYFTVLFEAIVLLIMYRKTYDINWFKICCFLVKSSMLLLLACFFIVEFILPQSIVADMDVLDVLFSIIDTKGESTQYLSNVARISTQVAAWNMFLDNPFFGVGYGQFAFYYQYYVPSWSWESYEVIEWATNSGNVLNGCFGIYARFFAEIGLIGALIWILFLFITLRDIFYARISHEYKICFLCSFFALILFGWNFSTIRLPYYWIFFALTWALNDKSAGEDCIE